MSTFCCHALCLVDPGQLAQGEGEGVLTRQAMAVKVPVSTADGEQERGELSHEGQSGGSAGDRDSTPDVDSEHTTHIPSPLWGSGIKLQGTHGKWTRPPHVRVPTL